MSNSKNSNLFYRLYSRSNDVANSGFVCSNAVDEHDTSFDINQSNGEITDSNGDTVSSIDMSQIHAEGISEYYTETKIIGPQSAYLLQGNVTGDTYAAQFFPIVKQIQQFDGYEPFINVRFCINYVCCSQLKHALIDTYRLRTQPQDVCELIQAKLDELQIPVAVSIRSLDICGCNDMTCCKKNNQIDYLVFQSTLEGYSFFVYNVFVSACDYTYENFNREWVDYTESPFVGAVINFDTILDLIRSAQPRRVGQGTPGSYDKVPCDLYKYFISIVPMAINQGDAFMHNFDCLLKFEPLFNDEGELTNDQQGLFVTLSHLYPDIYAYYFGHEGALLNKYNIHDIIKMLRQVSDYINSSNVAGPYKLVEDYDKRLGPQKYPNGAFRGIVLVPDWPESSESGIDKYAALRLAHVSDYISVEERVEVPENMRVEGYVCNGCKDVFIKHRAEVKVNTLLQSELEVYNQCDCALPMRKIVSNDGLSKEFEDDVWTSALHDPISNDDLWTNDPNYKYEDYDIWVGPGAGRDTEVEVSNKPAENWDDEYVDDYKTPSKYDWMARVPARMPNNSEEPQKRTVGLYRYMQHLSENDMWLKVGEGYMTVGLEDDYQSKVCNLQSSVLLYNPNPVPVRVRFMVFS